MSSAHLPIVLLLGAKSTLKPLASIPAELSSLKTLLEARQTGIPPFAIQYEPYFTHDQLKTTLDQLAGRVAILHFAGHSDGGALLSDDKAVYAQHLATHISTWSRPPDLIFLNGCHNAAQVEAFHAAGVPVVIATHRAINDAQAAGFAREFYAALLADGGQVALQAAFTRAGSKVLLSEARQARSLDIDTLKQDGEQAWDWGLFPRQPQQAAWTLRQLLTQERPRFDANGVLLNPYRGLEAFREEDRAYFFGREALTGELCDKIPATRLFALWGASGSGKSSLVSAGVIPRLRETGDWLILKTRPGNAPFGELASLFAAILHPDPQQAVERLRRRKALESAFREQQLSLVELLQDVWGSSGQARALLCIDQFEELFTHSDPATVRAYESQLIRLVEADLKGCTLLLVMRADFLAAALANEAFTRLLNQHSTELLPPMGSAELRAAIEQPARKQRVSVEPALTEALLDAVENQPGSLPLLQYVLSLLWEQRDGDGLRLDTYNQFGGLEKALEIRANSILAGFSDPEQEQAKHIFLRLIQPGEGSEDTRRRADLREFGDDPAARHIIQALADARLITTQQTDGNEAAFAEVSHEALIRHWGKLREWIADNRDALRTQHQISKGAKDWADGGRDAAWLLTGSRLAVAQEWLKGNVGRASELEAAFIDTSIHERDRQTLEKERVRKRNRNTLLGFIAVLVIVLLATIFFAVQADKQSKRAMQQVINANVQNLLTKAHTIVQDQNEHNGYADRALLLSLQAVQMDKTKKNTSDIYNTMSHFLNKVSTNFFPYQISTYKVFVGDNCWIFHPDGRLTVWDMETGGVAKTYELPVLINHRPTNHLFSTEVERLVTLDGERNTLLFWNSQGKPLSEKPVPTGQEHVGMELSPTGLLVTLDYENNTLRFWDSQGKPLSEKPVPTGQESVGMQLSPTGLLVTSDGENNTLRFWDSQGKPLSDEPVPTGQERMTMQLSPTGLLVTLDYENNTLRFWDSQGKPLSEKPVPTGQEHVQMRLSPIGLLVTLDYGNNTLRFWDSQGKPLSEKPVPTGQESVVGMELSPTGLLVTSDGENNTLRFWDSQGKPLSEKPVPTGQERVGMQLSPTGLLVTSDGENNTLRFWDSQGKPLNEEPVHTEQNIESMGFSSAGLLVTLDAENDTLRFWDSQGKPLSDEPVPTGQERMTMQLSPTGLLVTSDGENNRLRFWDRQGKPLAAPFPTGQSRVGMLHFDKFLTTLSNDEEDTLRVWDRQGRPLIHDPIPAKDWSMAFSYVDHHLVTWNFDKNTLEFWDSQGKLLSESIPTEQELGLYGMVFSPSGLLVTSDDENDTLRFWDRHGKSLSDDPIPTGQDNPSMEFSPTGLLVTLDDENNTLRFWDTQGKPLSNEPIPTGQERVEIQFSPAGLLVTTDSENNTLRFWDTQGKPLSNEPIPTGQKSVKTQFSPSGLLVTTDSENNTLRFWDTQGKPLSNEPIPTGQERVEAQFSPAGLLVTTDSENNTLRFWDGEGKLVGEPVLNVDATAFSLTGLLVTLDSKNNTLRFWDNQGNLISAPIPTGQENISMEFSEVGLLITKGNNTLRFWDAGTQKASKIYVGYSFDTIISSRSQPFFLTYQNLSLETTLWNAQTLMPVIDRFTLPSPIEAFSEDGEYLAFLTKNNEIYTFNLFDLTPEGLHKRACYIANRNLTAAEWKQYIGNLLPDQPYEKTCDKFPLPPDMEKEGIDVANNHNPDWWQHLVNLFTMEVSTP